MVRRSVFLALVAMFGLVAVGRSAPQSVDDLVAKNLEAKGGLAKLKAIQTIKQTSKMTMQGMDATLTLYSKRPNLMRQEASVGGQLVINGFDGVTPWIVNPLAGSPRPMAVSGPQADSIREQSNFDGPLVDYKDKGYVVELLGTETLNEKQVFHLRLTSTRRQVSHLYIGTVTGLDAKLTTEVDKLTKLEQEFSDYRDVQGIKVPFAIRTVMNGVPQSEIRVQSVEFNVRVDDSMFRMPKGF